MGYVKFKAQMRLEFADENEPVVTIDCQHDDLELFKQDIQDALNLLEKRAALEFVTEENRNFATLIPHRRAVMLLKRGEVRPATPAEINESFGDLWPPTAKPNDQP